MPLRVQLPIPAKASIVERVARLEIPFSTYGIDAYGCDRAELARFFTALEWLYRKYFRVQVLGASQIPPRGRAMLIGNHSGGVAFDALMVVASAFFECEPPRLAQGMVEYFINKFPLASQMSGRLGQFTGLPEHAVRFLEAERLLMVFPEGARGTAKLFRERDSLVRFGTGFMRLALQTHSPIVPFGVVGAGEVMPTIMNLERLGRMFGVPYLPLTPYLLPLPLPAKIQILYGEPMRFDGDGSESDDVVQGWVDRVRDRVAHLVRQGRAVRHGRIPESAVRLG